MLSLNFMDPNSLMTWLEMRTMAFDVGLKYSLRVKSSMTVFVAFTFLMVGLLVAKGFNRLTALDSVFTIYHWTITMTQLFLTLVFLVPALVSAA
jgi:hypothetical protein